MNLKIYITFIIGLITSVVFAQQAELSVKLSKNKLGLNQRLRVQFTINKQGGDNFTPPNFKNFKVVGGPSQQVNQSIKRFNGKTEIVFFQTYSYIIQPKNIGEFDLPSASIDINGETISSKPVKVIVTKAVEVPKDPNDPTYIANQNIHLVAEISKAKPYVGEGIYVEYRLYVSGNVNVYDYAVTEPPQYNGFWNQEIDSNNNKVKQGKYNGEDYRYVVLQKALLIPTKEGKLTLDPMKMDVMVGVPTGRADFFGNMRMNKVRKEFVSAKKVIRAQALPLANKPEDFNGAVGDFNYTVTTSKKALKANESSELKVSVTGKGNLKLFELPKLVTPKELEVYDPERKERVKVTGTGIKGEVSENYTVVPQYKGKYKIPKTSFSYFDPKEKQYYTISTDDVYVDVLEGKELPKEAIETSTVTKEALVAKGENFRYIQTSTSLQSAKPSRFFNSGVFYLLLILPFLAIPLAVFYTKKKEAEEGDVLGNKQRKADRLAKKYLFEAQNKLGDKEAFYESLERALHNYLKAKLGVETSEISKDKITNVLTDKGVETKAVLEFTNVLNDCDFARYTPITDTEMQEEYEKAKQVITQLDKQL